MELSNQSITSLRKQLTSGDICSADIIGSLADAIEKKDGEIGAYLSHDLDAAREAAKTADLSLPLGGIPIAIKDNINVKGSNLSIELLQDTREDLMGSSTQENLK